MDGKFDNYGKDRDYPYKNLTTKLSKYLKFGSVSVRECYHIMNSELAREIIWKEFYAQLLYAFPTLLSNGKGLPNRYNLKLWKPTDLKLFNAWKTGKTGFPLIDASMRCLNATGWLHNRLRMVVASFLVKDCFIDWRKGEKYFANKLVDYDPASNNGGWRWSTGVGADAQVYYRIFNPWTQSLKYDPDAKFIKQWVPELNDISSNHIHKWFKYHTQYPNIYITPCLDHDITRLEALKLYKQVSKQ
jgi:deoxyribodipyrimidine photo-lyase